MNFEATERIWNLLLGVHNWLIKDFINKINYGHGPIWDDDYQPFLEAHRSLKEDRFQLETEVYRMSKKALEEAVWANLEKFCETTNSKIQARDSGNHALQKTLHERMNVEYTGLVREFEDQLEEIKTVIERMNREAPRISLPSLRHVGGGIIVDSPHAEQTNVGRDFNADMGSKYNISGGQIGAVGDHASASGNTFNQWTQSGGDLEKLTKELAVLRAELAKQATQPDQFEEIASIARAEAAATQGDGPAVFEYLKKAGQWAIGVATSIGVPVAVEAIKKAVGG